MPVCRALKIPLLAIFYGADTTERKILIKYKKSYQKLSYHDSCIMITVSEELKKKLVSFGINHNKIHVIPCGVDTSKFKPEINKAKTKDFISIGRFVKKKGHYYTILAFSKVVQKFPEARLIIVGDGDLSSELKKLTIKLGIQTSVIFKGVIDRIKIIDLMKSSFAFVQHSVTAKNGDMEGTPVSILESGASGLPIVSTIHSGIKQAVIHGKTGFLVEETYVKGMANYMIKLCENPKLAEELGINGHVHVKKNYQLKKQIKKIHYLAEKAIITNKKG